jgi:hypothetical protein
VKISDALGLSYRSINQMNEIINTKLSGRPSFLCKKVTIGHEDLEFYHRDIIECVRSLYGDPQFAQVLAFASERHYTSAECLCCIYNEMHTGNWWWSVQVCYQILLMTCIDQPHQTTIEACRPGAMIIPLIVSSDKTLLTHFRNKMAYLIYMTIGNIPKDICHKPSHHAQLLIGYIPTTKLSGITNKAARCHALANLFHVCMDLVLGPIRSYGETGITMMSGDGVWRQYHLILAAFVGDYPKQALVTCMYSSRCPKYTVLTGQLGKYQNFSAHVQSAVIDTYILADGDAHAFHTACSILGMPSTCQHLPFDHPRYSSPNASRYGKASDSLASQYLWSIRNRHVVQGDPP